jgi:hypothetical protein
MSWQDLKDAFKANEATAAIKFADIKDGNGLAGFETREQAEAAIQFFNNTNMKNKSGDESVVTLILQEAPRTEEQPREEESRADDQMESREDSRDRSRSRGSPRYD